MSLKPTGFCWGCGVLTGELNPNNSDIITRTKLFCSKKHEEQYKRKQDRKIIKGKRAGYGLAGSTH